MILDSWCYILSILAETYTKDLKCLLSGLNDYVIAEARKAHTKFQLRHQPTVQSRLSCRRKTPFTKRSQARKILHPSCQMPKLSCRRIWSTKTRLSKNTLNFLGKNKNTLQLYKEANILYATAHRTSTFKGYLPAEDIAQC